MPAGPQAKETLAFRKTASTFKPGAQTLPQGYFVSPEIFQKELHVLFSNQWVLVGHQSQLANAGDYFLAQVAGESLIITRDQRDAIGGFYNVCRHRGTRLKEDACGHASTIQCPYHAWTYGLDGRLVGAPHMDDVSGFEKADYSLKPVKLGILEGFIFVNLANADALTSILCPPTHPTDPKVRSQRERQKQNAADASTERGRYVGLDEWFAPLAGKFSGWNMPILRGAKRIEYNVRANWKLMFENYSECYHCPGVHPMLQKISPYDSAENDLTEGPFLGGFMAIHEGKSLTMSGDCCALPVGEIENLQQVFYYSIFPNMLLSMHPEYIMVHQLWPQSPDRTLIVCDWLFHPDAFSRPDFRPNDAIEFWDMTNKQDWHVCELSQQGIASRAYEPGPYSSRESIPAAWDHYYLEQML